MATHMSATALKWAFKYGVGPPADRLVLLTVAWRTMPTSGETRPTTRRDIMAHTGLSRSTVDAAVERLEPAGLISVHRNRGRHPNTYQLGGEPADFEQVEPAEFQQVEPDPTCRDSTRNLPKSGTYPAEIQQVTCRKSAGSSLFYENTQNVQKDQAHVSAETAARFGGEPVKLFDEFFERGRRSGIIDTAAVDAP